jgi:DNA (cytosine-5)-methyltransferase 1
MAHSSRVAPPIQSLLGDLDLAVLKPENQTPTHVTPLIAKLAQGLVKEELVVIGPPPPPVDKDVLTAEAAHQHLKELIITAKGRPTRPRVEINKKRDFWGRGSRFLRSVEINGDLYKVDLR